MTAALYVDVSRGPYVALGVDAWGEERDATTYPGPGPVIAHPPCGPWSRLRHMCGPALLAQEGLGPAAVAQVRRWRGVLEHPADSRLWTTCRMPAPGELPDEYGGWTVAVEQWWWGHRAVKPTWLYIVGTFDIPLIRTALGARPASGGRVAMARDPKLRSMLERLPRSQRHLTPPAFALWLVELAERCGAQVISPRPDRVRPARPTPRSRAQKLPTIPRTPRTEVAEAEARLGIVRAKARRETRRERAAQAAMDRAISSGDVDL